jgi:hypothetical protein
MFRIKSVEFNDTKSLCFYNSNYIPFLESRISPPEEMGPMGKKTKWYGPIMNG